MIADYPELKQKMESMRSQSVTPNYNAMPGGSGISRKTENAALRELDADEMIDYLAVENAIQETLKLENGNDIMKLIKMTFWGRKTIAQATAWIPYSERQLQRFNADFIRRVWKHFKILVNKQIE